MENGILKDLGLTLNKLIMVPEEFWIYDNKMVEELELAFKKIAVIASSITKIKLPTTDWLFYDLYNMRELSLEKRQNKSIKKIINLIEKKAFIGKLWSLSHFLVIFFFKCSNIVSL